MARLQRVTDHLWRVGLPSYTLPPHGVTYSYLWGKNRLALLDVGSRPGEGHLLLEAVGELGWPVETIFLSHHHPDHVAGLQEVYDALGRPPVRAHGWTRQALQGPLSGVVLGPDLKEGERVEAGGLEARVLLTPGHAPGHVSFYLPGEKVVLLGDLLVGEGSGTVVIVPPEGDLLAYEESLRKVAALGDILGAPAHGELILSLGEGARKALQHKKDREHQVLALLQAHGRGATLEELSTEVYGENLGEPVAFLASRTLLAHLLKLEAQGQARQDGEGRWFSVGEGL